jgi:hypothetical protein
MLSLFFSTVKTYFTPSNEAAVFRNRSHYCLWYLNPSLFRMWFKNAAKMWP